MVRHEARVTFTHPRCPWSGGDILTRFSHHLSAEAHNGPAITSLRLLAVLTVLSKYASARRAARALY